MKSRVFHILLFGLSWGTLLPAQTRFKLERINRFERELHLPSDSVATIWQLPDIFIVSGSDSIWLNRVRLTPETDYVLDDIHGRIVFKHSLEKGQALHIKYQHLPIQLAPQYQLHQLTPLTAEQDSLPPALKISRMLPGPESESAAWAATSELQKSGSIVRGISIGSNQGLKLDSGLRMQVSGRIANKIEVIAALTDQNTPIQPEGNTQSLQEIDKVFVEIKGDHFQATLGDYQMQFQDGEFGRYSRKLQGAMGTFKLKPAEITLAGAISRGQYTTNQFNGREGNQGPYQLKGAQGQIDIIVIAGTERVWINGELMLRGENNDYVIEYGNGQISFTRRRLITEDSRITVDFQYSDQKFRRNLYGSRVVVDAWDQKVQLTTSFIAELDDKQNPLEFSLSDENRQKLAQAGDALDSAYVSGALAVGAGQGAYIQVDSAGTRFYRYVGENQGDYRVTFSFVGYGRGDYQLQGFGKYRYAGPQKGSYLAQVQLYPARSQGLLDLNLNFNPLKYFKLNSELAFSRYDKNTYSRLDDADNQGLAYKLQFGFTPAVVPRVGRFQLQGKFRYVNPRFQNLDRTTEVEYNRRWDLGTQTANQEQLFELSGFYYPLPEWSFQSHLGQIAKGSGFQSKRLEFQSQFARPRRPQYDFRLEQIHSQDQATQRKGDWFRQRGNVQYQWWKLTPRVVFEQEIKKETTADSSRNTGFRFDQYQGDLAWQVSPRLLISAGWSERQDQLWQNQALQPQSSARTQQFQMELAPRQRLSASINYTHRNRQYFDNQPNKRTDLAEIQINYQPLRPIISGSWNYQIANTQTAQRERQYLEVSEGEGNYRFDPNLKEFVPDPLGNYEIRILNTNIFIPVIELKTSLNFKFKANQWLKESAEIGLKPTKSNEKRQPEKSIDEMELWDWFKKIPWRKFSRSFSSETLVRLEERTREREVYEIYRINLNKFQTDSTIYGTQFFRHTCYFGEDQRTFSLRLRFQQENTVNRQFLEGGERRLQIERSVRVTWALARGFSGQGEFLNQRKGRFFNYAGRESRDIKSRELTVDLSWRPGTNLELALKNRNMRDVDKFPGVNTTATLLSFIPSANYSFRTRGRLATQFEWSQVQATREFLPYEMVYGNAPGKTQRWEVSFNYRISKNVQGSLTYNGRNEKHRGGVYHLGRAEVRAFF